MKIRVIEEPGVQKELIIRCESVDEQIRKLLRLLSSQNKRIVAIEGSDTRFFDPASVLYFEYVDRNVFVYTEHTVLPTGASLAEIENDFSDQGFIRCSKSMVVNINRIAALKSGSGGRIIATIDNGEKIMISRHYARILREKLSQ
jgi:DNA-binding LytR/AlgR family response regulator